MRRKVGKFTFVFYHWISTIIFILNKTFFFLGPTKQASRDIIIHELFTLLSHESMNFKVNLMISSKNRDSTRISSTNLKEFQFNFLVLWVEPPHEKVAYVLETNWTKLFFALIKLKFLEMTVNVTAAVIKTMMNVNLKNNAYKNHLV